jgi:hypothetical protein
MTVTNYPILTPTSGGSITTATGNVYKLTSAGVVTKNNVVMTNNDGTPLPPTSLLSYIAANSLVYRQIAATLAWMAWNGGSWSSVVAPPILPGKPTVQLSNPTSTTIRVTITEPTDGNASTGNHVQWRAWTQVS